MALRRHIFAGPDLAGPGGTPADVEQQVLRELAIAWIQHNYNEFTFLPRRRSLRPTDDHPADRISILHYCAIGWFTFAVDTDRARCALHGRDWWSPGVAGRAAHLHPAGSVLGDIELAMRHSRASDPFWAPGGWRAQLDGSFGERKNRRGEVCWQDYAFAAVLVP